MKKLFFILFSVSLTLVAVLACFQAFYAPNQNQAIAASNQEHFARIKFAGVFLYKTPTLNETYINMHFEMPNTYFVKLLSDANTYFYRAQYMEQIGYVKKNEVQPISGQPINPYATATSQIFSGDGIDMRDAPYYAAAKISTIQPNTRVSVKYIGKISGEEATPEKGNIWYFCEYGNTSGYVYSLFCDKPNIQSNNEVFSETSNPFSNSSPSYIEDFKTGNVKFIVIIAVMLPAFVVFFLLFIKITPKTKTSNTQKFKKVKSVKPQYLYDDNEL